MSYDILLQGIGFVLSYFTQRSNEYVTGIGHVDTDAFDPLEKFQ